MSIFSGKRIILGITGSIAAYKGADLASKLTQAGAQVETVFSSGAEKFVTPLTFQSVTGRKAFTDAELWGGEAHVLHVGLGHAADLLIIAPCTANTLAKLAHGQADNLLTVTALAAECPILIAPAMDGGMYAHPATQENVRILSERGVTFVGPAPGHLASGLVGVGRMSEPLEILGMARLTLGRKLGRLRGKRLVITAGGSQEPIDPVRVISNRSSGRQGYALAQAALEMGAAVTLISHPTALSAPSGADVVRVETAQQMLEAVSAAIKDADGLVMAAAVADFRVRTVAESKIKKRDGIPQIQLEAAPDVLAAVARLREAAPRLKFVVGFAAESHDLLENAQSKLISKKLDMIVANDISASDAGFGVETNRVCLLYGDGRQEQLPLLSKYEVAEYILARVAESLE
ncbi:MAG: bifunctional phosphopantothenoylcysteine decarboxylase/phosphopantothenate--cysteine ligase CoaBC [Anaerolineales bacterium]|jgi:phosphopantothenoylcysteine decarboxylase/phosphopantothenate--cysteine ligase|nr:bifunctional phosphopantothenoylcysteine decarboxylase/phosphopantothenate--cysteine ligase CoaBC [Anaerolineales bacterium]